MEKRESTFRALFALLIFLSWAAGFMTHHYSDRIVNRLFPIAETTGSQGPSPSQKGDTNG